MYRDHRKGPGGPPGGATYPGGPRGLKWEGNQPLVGWAPPMGLPHAPRVGNPRGGVSPCLGGQGNPFPPWPPPPPWRSHLQGLRTPLGGLYKGGGREGSRIYSLWRLPPPLQHLSLARRSSAKPCRRATTSTTTPSCCWISINLSSPLAGSRKEETSLHRTCVERGGAVRSALGHR